MAEVTTHLDVEEVFDFLVNLRDSGITNMWGAAPYVEEHFECSKEEAGYWLVEWIKSYK